MADSPTKNAEGPVRVTIKSDGMAVAETVRLVSVHVQRAVNTIPRARLVVEDGDMPNQTWPLADAHTFKPGAEITIAAGYGANETTIFTGIVVKLGLKVSGENYSRLTVECQDKAVKMTVGRKNANYVDKTDSAIIQALAKAHGVTISTDTTAEQHAEIVQYYCTDWDFLVARAEVNGLLAIATDGKLSVKAPDTTGPAALKVTYGADLYEFQGDIDARTQLTSVQAKGWDHKTLTVQKGTPAPPATLNAQGNLTSATLAQVVGLSSLTLQTSAALTKEALGAWAKAQQVKAGLARVRGKMKFQGSAKAKVGELITIEGMGARFDGEVFVGALEHEIADGNWFTEAEFGLPPDWFVERAAVRAPPAAGWTAAAEGLQVGIVTKLDGDPLGEHRIQVKVPMLEATTPGIWARLAQSHASNAFGAFFVPEIGDEVIIGYFNNDPSYPVILGSLYSSGRAPNYTLEAANNTKGFVSRCLAKIEIDEAKKSITIVTPGKNQIVLNDTEKSIVIEDQHKNKATFDSSGITLDSKKDVTIKATGSMTLEATGAVSIKSSGGDATLKGLNVTCEGQMAFTGKGSATAELSASGQTTVKGAMVMIN